MAPKEVWIGILKPNMQNIQIFIVSKWLNQMLHVDKDHQKSLTVGPITMKLCTLMHIVPPDS